MKTLPKAQTTSSVGWARCVRGGVRSGSGHRMSFRSGDRRGIVWSRIEAFLFLGNITKLTRDNLAVVKLALIMTVELLLE